jgi:uncharacterized protein YuzE
VKVTYDSDTDTLRILLSDSQIDDSDEGRPGVVLDYDKCGNVVDIEILDASRRMENPKAVEFVVSG